MKSDRELLEDALRYGSPREVRQAMKGMDFDDVAEAHERAWTGRVTNHAVTTRDYTVTRRGYGCDVRRNGE